MNLIHRFFCVAAVAACGLVPSCAVAAGGFDAPTISFFSAHVSSCSESAFRCIDVSWKVHDAGSPGLLYDLSVEHSSGRVTFEGEGTLRPGKPLRASLVPAARPLCGTYILTLTITNQSALRTTRATTVTRRSHCVRRDPRLK